MEIPLYYASLAQLILNILCILCLEYIFYLIIKLIYKVRKGNDIDKREYLKKVLIYSLIVIVIFAIINIFFEYDPFHIIQNSFQDPQNLINLL